MNFITLPFLLFSPILFLFLFLAFVFFAWFPPLNKKSKSQIILICFLTCSVLFLIYFLYKNHARSLIQNKQVTNLNTKDNFYYENNLLYHPKFSRIQNLNFGKFSDEYKNKNYIFRTKNVKDFSVMVLENEYIKKSLITNNLQNYSYVNYNNKKIDTDKANKKIEIDLDFPGNNILETESQESQKKLYLLLDNLCISNTFFNLLFTL